MNGHSTYKLLKVSGGITLFAEVTVSVSENAKSNEVIISEHAFDWLKEEYAKAVIWPVRDDDEFVKGARKGIEHVIKYLSPNRVKTFVTFIVEKIVVTEVDSTRDTIAYAACFAAWKALGLEPVSQPEIRGRQIIFE